MSSHIGANFIAMVLTKVVLKFLVMFRCTFLTYMNLALPTFRLFLLNKPLLQLANKVHCFSFNFSNNPKILRSDCTIVKIRCCCDHIMKWNSKEPLIRAYVICHMLDPLYIFCKLIYDGYCFTHVTASFASIVYYISFHFLNLNAASLFRHIRNDTCGIWHVDWSHFAKKHQLKKVLMIVSINPEASL